MFEVEKPYSKRTRREQVAELVYLNTIGQVMRDLVDSPRVRNFRDQIDESTSLSKGILLARAYSDLKNPEGRLVVAFTEGEKSDPFAVNVKFKLEGVDKEGKEISYEEPVVAVLLNTDSTASKRGKDGVIDVDSDDFFGVLSATVKAQSILEREGVHAMTRNKFNDAMERITGAST